MSSEGTTASERHSNDKHSMMQPLMPTVTQESTNTFKNVFTWQSNRILGTNNSLTPNSPTFKPWSLTAKDGKTPEVSSFHRCYFFQHQKSIQTCSVKGELNFVELHWKLKYIENLRNELRFFMEVHEPYQEPLRFVGLKTVDVSWCVHRGTHQILIRKLHDAMTRRKPGTIDHSRIISWSSGMGQNTSTKNILRNNNWLDYHCFPQKKCWPEALKGQSDRKE